jgi:hypothetical protein
MDRNLSAALSMTNGINAAAFRDIVDARLLPLQPASVIRLLLMGVCWSATFVRREFVCSEAASTSTNGA